MQSTLVRMQRLWCLPDTCQWHYLTPCAVSCFCVLQG